MRLGVQEIGGNEFVYLCQCEGWRGPKDASSVDRWLLSVPSAETGTVNGAGALTTLYMSIKATGGVMGSVGSDIIWIKLTVSIRRRDFW